MPGSLSVNREAPDRFANIKKATNSPTQPESTSDVVTVNDDALDRFANVRTSTNAVAQPDTSHGSSASSIPEHRQDLFDDFLNNEYSPATSSFSAGIRGWVDRVMPGSIQESIRARTPSDTSFVTTAPRQRGVPSRRLVWVASIVAILSVLIYSFEGSFFQASVDDVGYPEIEPVHIEVIELFAEFRKIQHDVNFDFSKTNGHACAAEVPADICRLMQEAIGYLNKHFNSAHPINLEIQKTMIQDLQWIRSLSHAPRTSHSILTDDEVRQYETKRAIWGEVAKLCAKVVQDGRNLAELLAKMEPRVDKELAFRGGRCPRNPFIHWGKIAFQGWDDCDALPRILRLLNMLQKTIPRLHDTHKAIGGMYQQMSDKYALSSAPRQLPLGIGLHEFLQNYLMLLTSLRNKIATCIDAVRPQAVLLEREVKKL